MKGRPACALCAGEAALFCEPDAAFLCWPCDASVHAANFLVARHVRLLACTLCRSLDASRCVSGPCPRRVRHLCPSCDRPAPSSPSHSASSSSSSSSCLSTSDSAAAARDEMPAFRRRRMRRRRREAEGMVEQVLLAWGRRMGLRNVRRCVEAAARAVGACRRRAIWFPSLRVTLSAALWFAVKLYEDGAAASSSTEKARAGAALLRLEACSGVPARLIQVAESRIARVAGRARVPEEGWAECS